MIQEMQGEMEVIINDINQQHPNWINTYDLISFTDNSIMQPVTTSDPKIFLTAFKEFAERNAKNTTLVRFIFSSGGAARSRDVRNSVSVEKWHGNTEIRKF